MSENGQDGKRVALRVLYIDDDETLRLLVKKHLERRGCAVVTAGTGAEGLALVASGQIDVVALDHTMPGETGLDVLAAMGRMPERPPVVYVTASGDTKVAVEALKAGADDYVAKDISPEFYDFLFASLEQAQERWRLRKLKAENERAIREARDRAELLLQEVNHRIGNSLGLVASMVRMQASVLKDQGAIDALRETQARITAIAGVHQRLYTSERIGTVEIADYLRNLMTELETSLRDADHSHRIRMDLDSLSVSIDKAVALGIIVSELVTNAFKYAYGENGPGEIRVSLKARDEETAVVAVEDDGYGFDPAAPVRGTGLGTRIMSAMAVNLGASIRHVPDRTGTRFEIVFSTLI